MQTIFLMVPLFCNLDVSFKGGFLVALTPRLCSTRSRFKTLQNSTALDPRAVLTDLTVLYIYYSRTSGLGSATYARLRSSGNNLSEKKRRLARVRGRWRDRGKVLHSELWQNRMYFLEKSGVKYYSRVYSCCSVWRCQLQLVKFLFGLFFVFPVEGWFWASDCYPFSWRLCELVVFYWLVWEKCWIMV